MTEQKVFKFAFLAAISTLKLGLKFPCSISVIWKRGEKLAEVLQRREIVNGTATFNEQLSIDCNMIFDVAKKQFEPKKTLFSILLFTDKGTKQAGEVEVDVSDLLNRRLEENSYELPLQKCPDKSATLSFKIRGMIKEEIKLDMISQSSFKTVDVQKVAGTVNSATANFKKKDKVEFVGSFPQVSAATMGAAGPIGPKTPRDFNSNDTKVKDLEDLNKKLKDDLKEAKKENDRLKKAVEDSTKNSDQWRTKFQAVKQELDKIQQANRVLKVLDNENKNLEVEVLTCKLKLASIFNAAFDIGGPQLADELQEASGFIENIRQ